MNRSYLKPGMLGLIFFAMGLHAKEKKIIYFGQVEYLTYSDAFNKNEDKFNDWVNRASEDLEAYESVGNTKNSGGAGVRVGALAMTPVKGLQIGGSLGYIMGPEFEGKASISSYALDEFGNPAAPYTIEHSVKDESDVWRVMAESKYTVPIGEKFQARLGFGFGVASLHIEEKVSDKIVGGSTINSENHSISTTKLTWEIGPAIAYGSSSMGIELALTYSQMPTAKDSRSFQEFNWNPFAILLGVEF
jgi:hypothetical protein